MGVRNVRLETSRGADACEPFTAVGEELMVNFGQIGQLPDARECRVEFEHVRKVLGALRSEAVAANTENNGNLALRR